MENISIPIEKYDELIELRTKVNLLGGMVANAVEKSFKDALDDEKPWANSIDEYFSIERICELFGWNVQRVLRSELKDILLNKKSEEASDGKE